VAASVREAVCPCVHPSVPVSGLFLVFHRKGLAFAFRVSIRPRRRCRGKCRIRWGPPKDYNACILKRFGQRLEIAVRRDKNELTSPRVVQYLQVCLASQTISQSTFRSGEQFAHNHNQLWRKALVKQELHPTEMRWSAAANSAAQA
jgi:hypothetical protein